jgi:hypothetical protein
MIWRWIAWNKGRERICDCGIARGKTEDIARVIAWQCIGGPHMAEIVEIEVKAVADERIAELRRALGEALGWWADCDGANAESAVRIAELRKLVTQ